MKALCLTLFTLLLVGCTALNTKHSSGTPQIDDALHSFQQALSDNNLPGIASMLTEDVLINNGENGTGFDSFIQTWRNPEPNPWGDLLARTDYILSQGGIQVTPTTWQFPYWTQISATHIDPERIDHILTPQTAKMAYIAGPQWTAYTQLPECTQVNQARLCPVSKGSALFETLEGETGLMTPNQFFTLTGHWKIVLTLTSQGWKISEINAGQ